MDRTHQTTASDSMNVVVRGSRHLGRVWPESTVASVPARRAAEVGDPQAVLELLAAVEGVDVDVYRRLHQPDPAGLRALTAHCEAAILQAALRVQGDLTPAAVVDILHRDLARRPTQQREHVALLAS